MRARSRHIREPTAGYIYDAAGERGHGNPRWGLQPVAGGGRPRGGPTKKPPSVEAVWTRLRGRLGKSAATSARPHETGAVDDATPRNRARLWPLASTLDRKRRQNADNGRKRRLFGPPQSRTPPIPCPPPRPSSTCPGTNRTASVWRLRARQTGHRRRNGAEKGSGTYEGALSGPPTVPDAADDVPTVSAVINMPENESDGVRLAVSATLAGRALEDRLEEALGPAARRGLLVGLGGQEAVPEAEALARGYLPAIYDAHGVLARRPGRASDFG